MFSQKTDKKTVKRSFVLAGGVFAFLLFTFNFTDFLLSPVLAAPDQELTYHGKLTDILGLSVADGNYDFTLTIYDSATGGACLWTARGNCTTPTSKSIAVSKGIFSTTLGESGDNPLNIAFDANYYLEVKIGSNSPMSPRRKITPTGFALNTQRLNGLTADNYIDTSATSQTKSGALAVNGNFTVNTDDFFVDTSNGNVGIGTISPSAKLHAISTAEQLRIGYDTSNYFSTTVNSTGMVTFNASGTGQGFTFSDLITTTLGLISTGSLTFNGVTNDIITGTNEHFSIMPNGTGNVGIGTITPTYKLDIAGATNTRDLITQNLIFSGNSSSILNAYYGYNGYTNFSGGIGTGGIDRITNAQRITSTGNLTNIGSVQAGEINLTRGGTFATKVDYPTDANSRSLATGDLNGDGRSDLAVLNLGGSNVSVLMNNGDGTYMAKVDYGTGMNPYAVALGDFNGDSKLDMAVTNLSENTVSIFINNGNGTFVAGVTYAAGSAPYNIAVGDLNGDGKADLVVGANAGTTISVLLNSGTGTFSTRTAYTTATAPRHVAIGDINGDSRADIVASNYSSTSVSVLRNNGNGTFAAKTDYATGTNPFGVAIGDLNGDDKADLVVTNLTATSVSVLLNSGTGTFPSKTDLTTATNPYSVAMGDFTGDGKTDLAVTNSGSASVSVFTNNGNGTFGTKVDYTTGLTPYSVVSRDLNSDGKTDLAVANSGSSSVSVLLNQPQSMLYAQVSTGNVGIGATLLSEKLTVNGAINIGNTSNAYAGTMRWNGSDFEGYDGSQWLSLTGGLGTVQALWDANNDTGIQVEESANEDMIRFDIAGTERMTLGTTGDLTLSGNFLPNADDTYTIGDNAHRWQDLYLGPNSLHIGTSTSDEGVISYDTTSNVLNIGTDAVTNGDIAFNTDQLFIDSVSGNVGIGTTITNEKLTVDGLISLAEQTTAPSVDAGYGKLYAGDDGKLYYQNGEGEEENISQVKKLVEDFVVDEGSSVNAGDVVAFVNETVKKGVNVTSFDNASYFNKEFYGQSQYISNVRLDNTHFVLVYSNSENSNYGTAVVGTISGTTITYGEEYIFNTASTTYISIASLDANHFVVAYQDGGNTNYGTAIVGSVVDSSISFGVEYVFNTASTPYIGGATALNTSSFVVAYSDGGNSYYGTAIVGSVSGAVITFGAENVFNAASTHDMSIAALNTSSFVVAYSDIGNSYYGTARVGLISGIDISSYSAESVFSAASTSDVSIIIMDSTHFVVGYAAGVSGSSIVGLISGNTIQSYGASANFGSGVQDLSLSTIDATHFLVASDNGYARIGVLSGVAVAFGATNSFVGASDISSGDPYISVSTIDSSHFVVNYSKYGSTTGVGSVVVGEFSGNAISSFGVETYINAGEYGSAINDEISIAVLDISHFVVVYADDGGLLGRTAGIAVIGTISNGIVSYGEEYDFVTFYSTIGDVSVAALDSTHFVIGWQDNYGAAIVGSISGTAITFGVANNYNVTAGDTGMTKIEVLDSAHFVVLYRDLSSGYAVARVGVVSGTTISSYGTAVNISAVDTDPGNIQKLDSTHFVTTYIINSTGFGVARVSSVSGTTITNGTASNFNAAVTTGRPSVSALDSTHFIVGYVDYGASSYGTARAASVSGTTITYGAESVFNTAITSYISVSALDSNHFVVSYQDGGNANRGTALNGVTSGTTIASYGSEAVFNLNDTNYADIANLDDTHFVVAYNDENDPNYATTKIGETSDRYLGIAQESCAANESCPVAIDGISNAHTGLTTGAVYYVTEAGDLTTTDTGYKVGMAISSTEIVIQSQGSTNQGDMYFGDMIFANDFRITEQLGSPLGLIFKNHLDQEIMTLDELGNMRITGQISAKTMNIGDHFFVDTVGNVGIGTAMPTQPLTVFNGTTTGTYTTEGWSHSSDARLKTNVTPIDGSLQKVMALNDVYFNWINDPQGNRQVGFVAQEVMNVLPEVVTGNEKDGYGIAYGNLTAILVGAMQEQQNIITNDGFRIDQNALSVVTFHNDTVNNLADVDAALGDIKEDQNILRSDFDDLYETNANMQADILEEVDLRIIERMQNLDESLKAVIQFAKAIDNDLLINADHLVFTDDEGNVTINGILAIDRVETEEVVTQKIIVREIAEDESIAGTATIIAGTYDVFVPTRTVTSRSRIFVTPRGLVEKTLGVTSVDDRSGFHVSIVGSASENITFDWFIVEKDGEDDAEEFAVDNSQDEINVDDDASQALDEGDDVK